ncbi:hypothetical protein VP1G_10501 [Cytospora mali]|uniref:Uncharacterized protein n=1 Tax=Cytospora mali TaxID=578113 RepID=A0A194ULT2_CYTMA|nr:hypothetical protein VP1G_10501 [Valsa mali var. pyri (nom. inval.)]
MSALDSPGKTVLLRQAGTGWWTWLAGRLTLRSHDGLGPSRALSSTLLRSRSTSSNAESPAPAPVSDDETLSARALGGGGAVAVAAAAAAAVVVVVVVVFIIAVIRFPLLPFPAHVVTGRGVLVLAVAVAVAVAVAAVVFGHGLGHLGRLVAVGPPGAAYEAEEDDGDEDVAEDPVARVLVVDGVFLLGVGDEFG